MKSVCCTNSLEGKSEKMTLRDYYQSLPDATHPKTELVNKIAVETGVSVATVRNWVLNNMKPQNPKHIEKLVEITGICAEELWG